MFHSKQRGFTLLLAALIASIVLSLAVAIFSIAQKQIALASLAQQSEYAYYAADTGAECALYWDVRPSVGYFYRLTPPGITPMCDGTTLSFTAPSGGQPYPYPYTFTFQVPINNGYCAVVNVQKCQGAITDYGFCCRNESLNLADGTCNAGSTENSISTQIRANGYSVSCSALGSSQGVLERSVVLNY